MPRTCDIQLDGPIMALFKGAPKTRKTTALASFPGPIYIADFDGRIEPIKKHFPERNDIEYDTYHSENYNSFMDKKNELLRNCPYKTVVLPDSLTYFVEATMNYAIDSRGGNAKTSSGKGHKSKGNISLLEIDDYGAETRIISELIDDLKIIHRKHKVNVIMTAHIMEKEIKNLEGKVTEIQQYLICYGTKVAAKIPGAFNEVYHFYVKENIDPTVGGQYMVKTQSSGKDFAGTALPNIPTEFEWTNKNFYNTLMGYVNGK